MDTMLLEDLWRCPFLPDELGSGFPRSEWGKPGQGPYASHLLFLWQLLPAAHHQPGPTSRQLCSPDSLALHKAQKP